MSRSQPVAQAAAPKPACDAKLRQLTNQGVFVGKRTRRGLCIRADSYYRWKGEVVPVLPDLGSRYEVVPDSDGDKVRRWQVDREGITEAFGLSPVAVRRNSPRSRGKA